MDMNHTSCAPSKSMKRSLPPNYWACYVPARIDLGQARGCLLLGRKTYSCKKTSPHTASQGIGNLHAGTAGSVQPIEQHSRRTSTPKKNNNTERTPANRTILHKTQQPATLPTRAMSTVMLPIASAISRPNWRLHWEKQMHYELRRHTQRNPQHLDATPVQPHDLPELLHPT